MTRLVITDKTPDVQREYLEREGGCKCLIHHPLDPEEREKLFDIVQNGLVIDAAIAIQALGACPTRESEN